MLMAARLAEGRRRDGLGFQVRVARRGPNRLERPRFVGGHLDVQTRAVAPVLTELAADLERLGGALSGNARGVVRVALPGEGPSELGDRNVDDRLDPGARQPRCGTAAGEAWWRSHVPRHFAGRCGGRSRGLGSIVPRRGRADVNLEDVRIEHTVGRMTAIAHLSVPRQRSRSCIGAAAGGWHITG